LALRLSDLDGARNYYGQALDLWQRLGQPIRIAEALSSLVGLAYQIGSYDDAEALAGKALLLLRSLHDEQCTAALLTKLAMAAMMRGQVDNARSIADEALRRANAIGGGDVVPLALHTRAWVALEEGDTRGARANVQKSLPLLTNLGLKAGVAASLMMLGLIARVEGDLDCAEALFRDYLRMAQEQQNLKTRAGIYLLGTIAALRGHAERAARLFAVDLATWSPTWARLFEEDEAAVRAALGERSFAAAKTAGRALSLQQAVDEALASPDADDAALHAKLTPRESEIVGLVAAGMTNAEMAVRLGIGERTIESHLSHALAKLRLTSRTRLVAWALSHDPGIRSPQDDARSPC
jgi:DNA-binding CsgD family transcriptional regulator/tetratricopeptide (TPR) repeat protein